MITQAQRTELIDDLVGTCNSLSEVLAQFNLTMDDLTVSDHQAIDNEIFCCDDCSWWCGIEEMAETETADGQYCCDCRGDEEE